MRSRPQLAAVSRRRGQKRKFDVVLAYVATASAISLVMGVIAFAGTGGQ